MRVLERAQPAPAPAQLGDERDPLVVRLVAHDVDLGVRAAVREPLEAHRARDDAAVDLGQRDVHRDVARVQAVRIGEPRVAIAAREDHLQHRRVAREHLGLSRVERARGERGGVQHERDVRVRAQRVDDRAAHRVLQRGHRDRQRVQPFALERGGERIEHRSVRGLPVRLVEQDRDHRRVLAPARAPVLEARAGLRRVIERGGGQRARRLGLVADAERVMRDAAQQRLRVRRPALAQIAPPLTAQLGRDGAFRDQVRIFLQVAREHRELLPGARSQRDRLLDPVRPVRLAAEMVDHDDARVPQHVVDVEIDRRRLSEERHVREPHARKAFAERRHGAREQRQRRVGRTQDHDVGRTLVDPDHARRVVDEAARRGAQQMHRATPRQARPARPGCAARRPPPRHAACPCAASAASNAHCSAAASRSSPISTKRLAGASPSRQRRSK